MVAGKLKEGDRLVNSSGVPVCGHIGPGEEVTVLAVTDDGRPVVGTDVSDEVPVGRNITLDQDTVKAFSPVT